MVALHKAQNKFTPDVRSSYIAYQKALAEDALKTQGKKVSSKFKGWVDSDPVVEATVYGTHSEPGELLAHFFSIGMDIGRANLEKYKQLALAAAMVSTKMGEESNTSLHLPIELKINGDPRVPVDTKDTKRKLDMNDHIINFLNENTIDGFVVNDGNEKLPELKYDENGVAVPPSVEVVAATGKEKKTRTLYAADVIASPELQTKFNAYMKSKGFPVDIDCGDGIINWNAHNMVRGEMNGKIDYAYKLFKTAYEEKGLLPKERDPSSSMGEKVLYLIRNYEHDFTAAVRKERKWPRFPLTAPWPVMTILVADNQPLREREERWIAFRDQGIFKTYGEYIGSVAQQFNMQSARRISPYPFTYGTIQMMLKDGGVCGTMGNISARSHITLGIPACTAGQPGHCAMIAYRYDDKKKFYYCKGGQYATGGDDKTTPHAGWFFGDDVVREQTKRGVTALRCVRRPMIYHQSITFAVNYGFDSFLDSIMVYNLFNMLPEKDRSSGGVKLLASGMSLNPYNFLVTDAIMKEVDDPIMAIKIWNGFKSMISSVKAKEGCPVDGLYNKTVRTRLFERLNELPVPNDKLAARKILKFLEDEECDYAAALAGYRMKLDGMTALKRRTENDFKQHLTLMQQKASRENDVDGEKMAATLKAVAECVKDKNDRKKWAESMLKIASGREMYFDHRNRIKMDPSIKILAKISKTKLPQEGELMAPVIQKLSEELTVSVTHSRTDKACKALAGKLKSVADSMKDDSVKREMVDVLGPIIKGKETFKQKGAKKSQRDPCADTIDQILSSIEK